MVAWYRDAPATKLRLWAGDLYKAAYSIQLQHCPVARAYATWLYHVQVHLIRQLSRPRSRASVRVRLPVSRSSSGPPRPGESPTNSDKLMRRINKSLQTLTNPQYLVMAPAMHVTAIDRSTAPFQHDGTSTTGSLPGFASEGNFLDATMPSVPTRSPGTYPLAVASDRSPSYMSSDNLERKAEDLA